MNESKRIWTIRKCRGFITQLPRDNHYGSYLPLKDLNVWIFFHRFVLNYCVIVARKKKIDEHWISCNWAIEHRTQATTKRRMTEYNIIAGDLRTYYVFISCVTQMLNGMRTAKNIWLNLWIKKITVLLDD